MKAAAVFFSFYTTWGGHSVISILPKKKTVQNALSRPWPVMTGPVFDINESHISFPLLQNINMVPPSLVHGL